MTLLIAFFVLSIVFSFLCSIWEAVLLSITPNYVTTLENKGGTVAENLVKFKQNIDRPLSAILTLNTIAHTVGAIGVGAQAGAVFGNDDISFVGFSFSYEAIIATVMTLAILILSEIIPKTIGANNWKNLAPFTITSLSILIKVLFPFVWLSQRITGLLKKNKVESVLSRSDFAVIAKKTAKGGSIEENEHAIIDNLLNMNELTVDDVMTPKTVMVLVSENLTVQEFYAKHKKNPFSRVPVYKNSEDIVTGFVLRDTILEELVNQNKTTLLADLKRDIVSVEDTMALQDCMKRLIDEDAHMAIVNNRHGSLVGIITLEDIIETLLGIEIIDETDLVADLQALARKKWLDRNKG
ncbi:MAG: hemolysin family protein [Flavobacteriales bacterium]